MKKAERIHVWRYVLRSRAALNAVSARRSFKGALLRIGDGFACLHPWPELGDGPLDDLLEELAAGEATSPLVRQAREMAALDASCRADGFSLQYLCEVPVPESHATVVMLKEEGIEEAVRRGFTVIKVKGGADYPQLAAQLDDLSRRWPGVIWRIDFNESLSKEETLRFVECLSEHLWKRIDFLEDPCPYAGDDWDEIRRVGGLALALDRRARAEDPAADVLVIKPVRDEVEVGTSGCQRLVVTSNMDHPLGQCYAAWRAAQLAHVTGRVDHCGLQTQDLFEATAFSECLGPARPRFAFAEGTGLGFDALLERLPWKRLK